MSLSSENSERKSRRQKFSLLIGEYKIKIDKGINKKDLDFDIFGEEKDYYINIIKMYIDIKKNKNKGFII
jgi:hypothetical protein